MPDKPDKRECDFDDMRVVRIVLASQTYESNVAALRAR